MLCFVWVGELGLPEGLVSVGCFCKALIVLMLLGSLLAAAQPVLDREVICSPNDWRRTSTSRSKKWRQIYAYDQLYHICHYEPPDEGTSQSEIQIEGH